MNLLTILIILTIVYIVYSKEKSKKPNEKHLDTGKTALNPLFSEKEIFDAQRLFTNWQKEFENNDNYFRQNETKEIQEFVGKKEDFKPSDNLISFLGKNVLAQFCVGLAKDNYEKMIESNIAVINGKNISDIETEFYQNKKVSIPYYNLDIINNDHWWTRNPEIETEYRKSLEERKDYWIKHWDSIKNEFVK